MAFFKRTPEQSPAEKLIYIRELKTIDDVIREVTLLRGKKMTREESDIIFTKIGTAINGMEASGFREFTEIVTINGEDKFVSLTNNNGTVMLSITKDPIRHH
jgi:hypothetical protein